MPTDSLTTQGRRHRLDAHLASCSAMAASALLGATGLLATPDAAHGGIYYTFPAGPGAGAGYTMEGTYESYPGGKFVGTYLSVNLEGSDGISPTVYYSLYGAYSYKYELTWHHAEDPIPGGFNFTTVVAETTSEVWVLWTTGAGGAGYGAYRVGAGVTIDSTLTTTYGGTYWKELGLISSLFAGQYMYMEFSAAYFGPYGQWSTSSSGYGTAVTYDNFQPFKFVHDTKSGYYYGYAQFYFLTSDFQPTLHLVAWGTPDETIITGSSVPEPGSTGLGALALGATALSSWRRRRKLAAADAS